jgi:hypothetical protein
MFSDIHCLSGLQGSIQMENPMKAIAAASRTIVAIAATSMVENRTGTAALVLNDPASRFNARQIRRQPVPPP